MSMISQADEAVRAMQMLEKCWANQHEVYLEQCCRHCGAAATYLIYYTNRDIQNVMLQLIAQYNCHNPKRCDLLDLAHFEQHYSAFLQQLKQAVALYAQQHHQPRNIAFEHVNSIFHQDYAAAC